MTTTRPAVFKMTINTQDDYHSPVAVFRMFEPRSSYVIDATTNGSADPGSDRGRIRPLIHASRDMEGVITGYQVTTRGMSTHGGSTRRTEFPTLKAAVKFVNRWANRRWRVAVTDGIKLTVKGDRYVMTGRPHGPHSLDIENTDRDRLQAHWTAYSAS